MTSPRPFSSSSSFTGSLEKQDFTNARTADDAASRPAWKRIFAGDAQEGYETQRALQSRHIMMIGACPPDLRRSRAEMRTSHRRDHWHGHLPQCGVGMCLLCLIA